MSEPIRAFQDRLAPILQHVSQLPLATASSPDDAAALASALERHLPRAEPAMLELTQALRDGVEAGWLCDRGEPSARFCRVAKASPDTHDLSIDVVCLQGPALRHRHPRGEITFGVAADPQAPGDPRFDGHPPGWVVMPPGSIHTPTVTGPAMILLYVLPGGAVEWNPSPA